VNSEELIGAAVGERRKDFFLFTKAGHPGGWSREDWRPASILKTLERSLKRLRTDHVDLIQLHSCSERELRKGDVIAALKQARERGQTRFMGYSGDSAAARYAVECGEFNVLQTSVSIADQEALDLFLPLAREKNMGVIAKRPIANAAWKSGNRQGYGYTYWQRLQKLDYDFLRSDPDDSVGIALRFTLAAPGVHTAIVGTAKPDRWHQNAALLEAGPLPQAEFEKIRSRWREAADKSWVGQT
jgi:aryl-alcohol dehydrogenase-like predicted oxidoreductase